MTAQSDTDGELEAAVAGLDAAATHVAAAGNDAILRLLREEILDVRVRLSAELGKRSATSAAAGS